VPIYYLADGDRENSAIPARLDLISIHSAPEEGHSSQYGAMGTTAPSDSQKNSRRKKRRSTRNEMTHREKVELKHKIQVHEFSFGDYGST
jgi:hypothetical protein